MLALTVRQPFAELIAQRRKRLELRCWSTEYRGPLIICAGQQWHDRGVELYGRLGSLGVTVCEVRLVGVRGLELDDAEAACWPLTEDDVCCNFGWELELVSRLPAVPVRGQFRLFHLTATDETRVLQSLL